MAELSTRRRQDSTRRLVLRMSQLCGAIRDTLSARRVSVLVFDASSETVSLFAWDQPDDERLRELAGKWSRTPLEDFPAARSALLERAARRDRGCPARRAPPSRPGGRLRHDVGPPRAAARSRPGRHPRGRAGIRGGQRGHRLDRSARRRERWADPDARGARGRAVRGGLPDRADGCGRRRALARPAPSARSASGSPGGSAPGAAPPSCARTATWCRARRATRTGRATRRPGSGSAARRRPPSWSRR